MQPAQPTDLRDLLTKELAAFVAKDFHNSTFVDLLNAAQKDPTKYGDAVALLAAQISSARSTILFPDQPGPAPQALSSSYQITPEVSIVVCWERVVSDAGNLALRVYAAFLALPQTREASARAERRERASQVVIALRFMLLARLYAIRANINDNVTKP